MTLCRYLLDKRRLSSEYLISYRDILEEQIKPEWLLYVDMAYLYSKSQAFDLYQQYYEKALEKAKEPKDKALAIIECAEFLKS